MHKSLQLDIPDLYLHYKGGRYRRLLTARLSFVFRCVGSCADTVLFRGHHADHTDERPRPVIVFFSHEMRRVCVYDAGWNGAGDNNVVVYVSLTYGSVWVRSFAEFYGLAEHEGRSVMRFAPVR